MKGFAIALLSCFAFVSGTRAAEASGAATPELLKQARQLADAGKWSDAEATVRRFLKAQSTSADGRYLLGYILFKEDNPTDSLAEYTAAERYREPGAMDLEIIGCDYFLLQDYATADKWLTQSAGKDPSNELAIYFLARAKYNERHFDEAVPLFVRCRRLNPKNLKAQEFLGLCYRQLGRTRDAIEAFRAGVALANSAGFEGAEPYLNLGSTLLDDNQAPASVRYLIRSTQLEANNVRAHRELGKAYLQLHRLENARHELERAAQLDPQSAPTHFLLAETYRKLGLNAQAEAETAKYTSLGRSPDEPLSEARSLVRAGKLDAAGQVVDRYLSTHQNSADAHFLRGYIFFKQQKAKKSLAEYTEGAKYRTPSAADLEAVGADYVLLRDYVDADKWFSKSAEWEPTNFETLYYLGRTKYNESRFQEAIAVFQRCLKLRPRNVKVEDNLGLTYEGLDRMQDAKTAFETAISWEPAAGPKDAGPYLDLGMLLLDSGEGREALHYLLQALRISPQDMRVHRELGKAYMHLNDFPKARAELETSARLAPENAPVRFMLAQVYRKLGLAEKAQAETRRYKALAAAHPEE